VAQRVGERLLGDQLHLGIERPERRREAELERRARRPGPGPRCRAGRRASRPAPTWDPIGAPGPSSAWPSAPPWRSRRSSPPTRGPLRLRGRHPIGRLGPDDQKPSAMRSCAGCVDGRGVATPPNRRSGSTVLWHSVAPESRSRAAIAVDLSLIQVFRAARVNARFLRSAAARPRVLVR
jgi:hypothetical protein